MVICKLLHKNKIQTNQTAGKGLQRTDHLVCLRQNSTFNTECIISLHTYLTIPFAMLFTIFANVCSRGFSEPFWLTWEKEKEKERQYYSKACLKQQQLFQEEQVNAYQVDNHLLSIANYLRVKMSLEAIHLEEKGNVLTDVCYY